MVRDSLSDDYDYNEYCVDITWPICCMCLIMKGLWKCIIHDIESIMTILSFFMLVLKYFKKNTILSILWLYNLHKLYMLYIWKLYYDFNNLVIIPYTMILQFTVITTRGNKSLNPDRKNRNIIYSTDILTLYMHVLEYRCVDCMINRIRSNCLHKRTG